MIRKPYDWKEVDDDFILSKIDGAVFSAEELGVVEHISNEFTRVTPKTFLLVRGNKTYAVDTSGYHSIRYIQRIK